MKATIYLTEHKKQVDNQTISFFKEDSNGLIVGRKFTKDGVTYVNIWEDFIWQRRGGANRQGNVTVGILELIENRFDPTVFDINTSNKRGIFPNGQLICDNRNVRSLETGKVVSRESAMEDDLTKEIFDTDKDSGEPISFQPKRYEKKIDETKYTPTYTFYVQTIGKIITDDVMNFIDEYEGI